MPTLAWAVSVANRAGAVGAGKSANVVVWKVTSNGNLIRWGIRASLVSSNRVPVGSDVSSMSVSPVNAPDSVGAAIPLSRKLWMLKPSRTSQKAFANVPCDGEPMTSVTSSWPNVLLSTQNERSPSGKGLSRFETPEIVDVPGNAVSSSRLKNGNGSPESPVRLR